MMQQTALQTWAPIRITVPSAPAAAGWSALAIASIAVPAALVVAAIAQAVAPASTQPVSAPATFEVPVAAAADAPRATTELPSYFFVDWGAECETECPARVAE